jgi:FixJ family two-component response regulator
MVSTSAESPLSNPYVSVVDDDSSVREATSGLLRALGYDVRLFASAEDFLASGAAAETGCLISDVQMPGRSGFDLQADLSAQGRHVPIIFISAFANEANRARALAAGAAGFLAKPYSDMALADCLGSVFPLPAA